MVIMLARAVREVEKNLLQREGERRPNTRYKDVYLHLSSEPSDRDWHYKLKASWQPFDDVDEKDKDVDYDPGHHWETCMPETSTHAYIIFHWWACL